MGWRRGALFGAIVGVLLSGLPATWGTGAVAARPGTAGALVIEIEGVRSGEGQLRVAVYDRPERFGKDDGARTAREVPAVVGLNRLVITGLPPGRYAVAAYHDENGNDTFDRSWLGIPEEGYGFSRDAKPGLGPPQFVEAAFELGAEGGVSRFRMVYW